MDAAPQPTPQPTLELRGLDALDAPLPPPPAQSLALQAKVVPPAELARMRAPLQKYYAHQNALIEFYAAVDAQAAAEAQEGRPVGSQQGCPSPDRLVPSGPASAAPAAAAAAAGDAGDAGDAEGAAASLAIAASTYANVLLLIAKLVASVTSGSMAVIASTVDSVLDLCSGGILWTSERLAARVDRTNFPVGKSRYEPVAILLFACLMGCASFQIITESCQALTEAARAAPTITPAVLGILAATVGVKALLFAWCRLLTASPSCQALALDHSADVVNNIGTLAAVLVSSRYDFLWFLDPAMAILLALVMLFIWSRAAREQMAALTSQAASATQISRLVYIALTHEPARVKFVDTLCAYSIGHKLQVECDVGLDEAMPLKQAHDVGENLQRRLEALEDVERAFVHLDTEFEHSKHFEHRDPYAA
jgi:cation diffusion facilitator family transporter